MSSFAFMMLFRSVVSDSDLAGMMSDFESVVPGSDFVQLRWKLRLKCLKGMNEPGAESEKII